MLDPSRDEARRWAIEELAHREYQQARPGPLARALAWLLEQVRDWLDAVPAGSTSWWAIGMGVLLAVTAALIGYAVWRAGGLGGTSRASGGSVFGDEASQTAAEHRAAAEAAEAEADWERAAVERFRAVVRELEERTVLAPRPGRTAGEVAGEAGATLPDLLAPLTEASHIFDAVRYGGRAATGAQVARLREVDGAVLASRMVPA